MAILENETTSPNVAVERRLAQLQEAESLIEKAIELEDGTQQTMRKILDVIKGRTTHAAVVPLIRKRRSLSEKMLQNYEHLLVLIRREIAKLNEGGAMARATELAHKFNKQHDEFLALRKAVRRQSWWKTDWNRRVRVTEIMNRIEERMHHRRMLATKLIEFLRNEVV